DRGGVGHPRTAGMERGREREYGPIELSRHRTCRDASWCHSGQQALVDGQRLTDARANQILARGQIADSELSPVVADSVVPWDQHRPECKKAPFERDHANSDNRI